MTKPTFRLGLTLRWTGIGMIVAALIHLLFVAAGIRSWEGVEGLRKTTLFCISTGLTCWSLGWIRSYWRDRTYDRAVEALAAVAFIIEISLIGYQNWNGVQSHFNHETQVATWIERVMLIAIVLATLTIVHDTLRCWTEIGIQTLSAPMRRAIRSGMLFLVGSCGIGFLISYLGWYQISQGIEHDRWGAKGALKFPHGATIHAIQSIPAIAWLVTNYARTLGLLLVNFVIGCHCTLLVYSLAQTFSGRNRWELDSLGITIWILGLTMTAFYSTITSSRLVPPTNSHP